MSLILNLADSPFLTEVYLTGLSLDEEGLLHPVVRNHVVIEHMDDIDDGNPKDPHTEPTLPISKTIVHLHLS